MRWGILDVGVAVLAVLSGCTDTEKSAIAPHIGLYLDDKPPVIAYVPGTVIDVDVAWAAQCTTHGIGDTSTTEYCDDQDFVATVTCTGAPCDLDPPAASTGLALTGDGHVRITPAIGNTTIDVVIEHADTHEQLAKRSQIAIRAMDKLVIDCRLQAYDAANPRCVHRDNFVECFDRPWIACPTQAIADPEWGTPVSMWVYGEGSGMPIATARSIPGTASDAFPSVEFTGLALTRTDYSDTNAHPTPGASAVALKFEDDMKAAGTLRTTARLEGTVTQAAMDLVAP